MYGKVIVILLVLRSPLKGLNDFKLSILVFLKCITATVSAACTFLLVM